MLTRNDSAPQHAGLWEVHKNSIMGFLATCLSYPSIWFPPALLCAP